MEDGETGERVIVRFRLRLDDQSFDAEADVPRGPTPVARILPVLEPVADAVVAAAVRRIEAQGGQISCGAGCGACCRQPVPIAEAEARRLVELMGQWDAPRRSRVEGRFQSAIAALEDAGLADRLRALSEIDDLDQRQALGRAYFDLAIACPFLEDESCSIHRERPLACREYLVTSDARHCADPAAEVIDMVPMPVRASLALFRLREGEVHAEPSSLVLVFAREWWADHPEADPAVAPGPSLLEGFVRELAGEAR
jgi:Fe-S-cluster containining protein